MPNRIKGKNSYRYAYQGQEKDPETGKEAFQLRLWDGRIGRWLTPDPYGQFHSPYLGMGNNPIVMIDEDGGWVHIVAGAIIGGAAAAISIALEPGEMDWTSGRTWAKIGLGAATGASIAALPISSAGAFGGVTTRLVGSAVSAGAISTASDIVDQAIDVHNQGGNIAKMSQYNYSKSFTKGAITAATFGIGGYAFQKFSYQSTIKNWSGPLNNSAFTDVFYKAPNVGAALINSSLDIMNFSGDLMFREMMRNLNFNNASDNGMSERMITLPEVIINGSLRNNQNKINDHIKKNIDN